MDMPSRNGRARRTLAWAFLAGLFALGLFAAPVNAADPAKTLRVVLTSAEMSFDPQFSADAGSDGIIDHIYDSMLDYDYLARPVKLVPRTLEAMPMIADGGATYVFGFKRGIFFTPDPVFKGEPRELTAGDQAYALKRLLDPAVKSAWLWLIDGKIKGADDLRTKALKSGKFDYDAPMPGRTAISATRPAAAGSSKTFTLADLRWWRRFAGSDHLPRRMWYL